MNSDSDDPSDDVGPQKTKMSDDSVMNANATKSATNSQPPIKLKKAPDAPKRFRSAFIFFSTEKHKEIRKRMTDEGNSEKTVKIAKLVSEEWRNLSSEEREKWDALASRDKARYEVEKTMYKGPWKVPAVKRSLKDPTAPKRPMSAFLAFSNSRRAMVKKQNPHMGNAELSKHLSTMWKEAPDHIRQKYIDQEFSKRQAYKTSMADWKKKSSEGKRIERQQREDIALQRVDAEGRSLQDQVEESVLNSRGSDLRRSSYAASISLMPNTAVSAFGSHSSDLIHANRYTRYTSTSSSREHKSTDEKNDHTTAIQDNTIQPLASLLTSAINPYLLTNALTPQIGLGSRYEAGTNGVNPYSGYNASQGYNFFPGLLELSVTQHQGQRLEQYNPLISQRQPSQRSIASFVDGGYSPYLSANPFASSAYTLPQVRPESAMIGYPYTSNSGVAQGNRLTNSNSLYQSDPVEYAHATASGRVDNTDAAAYDLALRIQRRAFQQQQQNQFGSGSPSGPPG